MRPDRYSGKKNNSMKGNRMSSNFTLRKIGSVIRSIEEKSLKTDLISYIQWHKLVM